MDQPVRALDSAQRDLALLLDQISSSDQQALKSLYDLTSAKLYGFCLRMLGNEADAQEVLQDVYVNVWRKAARYDRAKSSPITWLVTMARNRSIDRLRSRRAPAEGLEAIENVADEERSALEVIEQAQDSARLGHCLEELEDRPRQMIRAAFLDGATYAELAEREAVPLGTMKSWIRRGLLRLRGCLER